MGSVFISFLGGSYRLVIGLCCVGGFRLTGSERRLRRLDDHETSTGRRDDLSLRWVLRRTRTCSLFWRVWRERDMSVMVRKVSKGRTLARQRKAAAGDKADSRSSSVLDDRDLREIGVLWVSGVLIGRFWAEDFSSRRYEGRVRSQFRERRWAERSILSFERMYVSVRVRVMCGEKDEHAEWRDGLWGTTVYFLFV